MVKDYADLVPQHPEWQSRLRLVCGLCVNTPDDPREVSLVVALHVAVLPTKQVWLMLRRLDRTRELELSVSRDNKDDLASLIVRSVLHGTVWVHLIEAGG